VQASAASGKSRSTPFLGYFTVGQQTGCTFRLARRAADMSTGCPSPAAGARGLCLPPALGLHVNVTASAPSRFTERSPADPPRSLSGVVDHQSRFGSRARAKLASGVGGARRERAAPVPTPDHAESGMLR
jgi:hypothetical protein